MRWRRKAQEKHNDSDTKQCRRPQTAAQRSGAGIDWTYHRTSGKGRLKNKSSTKKRKFCSLRRVMQGGPFSKVFSGCWVPPLLCGVFGSSILRTPGSAGFEVGLACKRTTPLGSQQRLGAPYDNQNQYSILVRRPPTPRQLIWPSSGGFCPLVPCSFFPLF